MQDLVRDHIGRSIQTKEKLLAQAGEIAHAGNLISETFKSGGKVLLCGNGGSAADAQHIATEFSIRYKAGNDRPSLPAISLAADSSAITAGGNDFGFDSIFARQIQGLGRPGDVLVGITTSGNSGNVREALRESRKKNMRTIVLTGGTGGRIAAEDRSLIDSMIIVPSDETSRIQECHIMIGQIFCAIVEKSLYGFD